MNEANVARMRLRSAVGFGLVLGALGLLTVRLAWLQLATIGDWKETARAQHYTQEMVVPAERGAILDRNGEVLARTERLPSLAVDPGMVKDGDALALLFERHVGVPRGEVTAALAKGGRFRWIRRQVRDRESVERLRRAARASRVEGLVVREEAKRVYPYGTLAAHVVGFTDRDGIGLEGLEKVRDRQLAGVAGKAVTLRDASGFEIVTAARPCLPPIDGTDVHTTLSLPIQSFAEEAADDVFKNHAPDGVSVAVLDVTTGEILGLAVRPNFDPNDPRTSKPEHRRNRFFTDAYEPGSVFKPIVMAAAMDMGAVRQGDTFTCNDGSFRVGGRVIHEDKHKAYGVLSLDGIIAHSSNAGMAQIGDRLGIARMKTALGVWGFGAQTAVRWPGEQTGDVQKRKTWTRGDQLVSVSFGHAVTVTPAQILQSYGVLAAGGVRHPLRLIAEEEAPRVLDPDAAAAPAREPERVCSAAVARALSPMLEAVLAEDGTAGWVYRSKDYRIGGKTGTAQKLATGGHVASFCCYGPLEEPRLAVIVIADEPRKNGYYGSTVGAKRAVPLLRSSLRALGVPSSPQARARGDTEIAAATAVIATDPATREDAR